ncbi:MAG: TonB-dependent receptor [Prevotella sp.]|nr:TonB-dependent receptor [Prevotella sp.]
MEKRLTMFLACLFLSVGMAMAQTKVTGTVLSQEDGEPIVGATIQVVGTKTGSLTDVNGHFSVDVPKSGATLRVSFLGFLPQEVAARNNMTVTLVPDDKSLDEVIVVAFGTAKKSAYTGSAAVVNADELSKAQVTSVTNALAGAVPGVQLVSSNGAPGATSTIRIRGFGSINAGQDPLIIVDGAPYSGDISNINPADVESMSVLKDAASNALYGARGANGVIMITTKNAKKGKDAIVTVDAKWGANTRALQHYDVIKSPARFYEMQYEALKNYYLDQGYSADAAWQTANKYLTGKVADGGVGYNIWTYPEGQMLIGQNGKLNPNATLGRVVNYKGEDYLIIPDDWEDVGTRTGFRQEYNVSVAGATDKSNFYMSLGYLDNEGITDASDLKRLTARIRGDYQAKPWLKVGGNISYARFDGNSMGNNGSSTSTGNLWAFTSQMAPIYSAYHRNADGSIKIDENGLKIMDYGEGYNGGQVRPFIYDANPINDSRLNTRNNEGNAFMGNGYVDIDILKGLKLTINGTFNLDETRYNYVYNPYYGQFDSTGGTVEMYHYRDYDYNLQQLLNYNTTIADRHNIGVTLGHEYTDSRDYRLYASKSKMFSQKNKELNGAVVDGQSSGSYKTRYNNEGYLGRVLYDYDTKYFFQGSYRRDASSRFHPDYRWGNFWSVGAAWLMNKESWFNVSWVDELKLKASIGQQGNDNIGNYRYTDVFDIVNSAGKTGTSFSSKGTKDISWETTTNFNAGVEFTLFHKLSGILDVYYRKTTDMLFSFSVAPSLGYSSYFDNVGDIYNTGVELSLNYNVIHSKDFDWDIHANINTNKNRISKLHEDKKTLVQYDTDGKEFWGYTSGSHFIAEDLSLYTWRYRDYAGVDEKTGKSLWYKNVYQKHQVTDADGNFVWELNEDKTQKLDENGQPIPVMTESWFDMNGNLIDDPDNYKGKKYRKVEGRETTDVYNDADYYVTKKSALANFFGGFGTTVRFHGFDFSINCSYQIGGHQYDGTYAAFMYSPTSSTAGYNFHTDLLKAWTSDNPSSTIPRFQWGDQYNASASTRFLTNASYLNIENINLGYTIPTRILPKNVLSGVRVYVAAENVFYWSKRKGFDPRQSFSSTTNATYYSPMRTISGGITLTF